MKRSCLVFAELSLVGLVFAQIAPAGTARYVAKNNPGAAAPYDTPANAAGDIQTAINYAEDGETILVAAGTYDTGGTNVPGMLLANRVYINKAITVRSANNDPAATIIKGAWAGNGQTNGPDAVRCVYIVKYAELSGFTLTGGATMSANEGAADDRIGGGLLAQSATVTVSNCVIAGCSAFGDRVNWYGVGGGGACYGTYYNCTFKDNATPYKGGGAADAILFNCTLAGNTADSGGGLYDGKMYGCVVSNNSAKGSGGGVSGGTLQGSTLVGNSARNGGGASGAALSNCTVAFNIASNAGGGISGCAASNCVIAYNSATTGGGAIGGTFDNCLFYGNDAFRAGGAVYGNFSLAHCTLVGNKANTYGGGLCAEGSPTVKNSIVYFNTSPNGTNWHAIKDGSLTFTGSCSWPETAGWPANNTTNDPLFMANGSGYGTNHVPGNYRLSPSSPLRETGIQN